MYRKFFTAVIIILFAFNTIGCSGALRRKFVRKKDAGDLEPVLQPDNYKSEFSNKQLYANHFAFWKAAEGEFIKAVEGKRNQKAQEMNASYAQTEIRKMYELLNEDKQKELTPLIEELSQMIDKMKEPNYIESHRNQFVRELQKHYRAVGRGFSYYDMVEFIRADD